MLTEASQPQDTMAARVGAVRAFNRFYTNVLGLLREGLLETPYSLTEARVIFELAQRDQVDAADLRRSLQIDPGYLSRLLGRFESDGLVSRKRSPSDGRRQVVRLTRHGRAVFETLDSRSAAEVGKLLAGLGEDEQRRLLEGMMAVRQVLEGAPHREPVVLRPPQPGDYGWVVQRHGAIYAEEYGWDESFEALVARIVADFVDRRNSRRESAWIAEVDGERAGCIFCVEKEQKVAQLRLLLVEPRFRGSGIGSRLVRECMRFAKRSGYEQMMLWTNDVLVDARRIYERAGFNLVEEERHHSFGHELVGQNWWCRL